MITADPVLERRVMAYVLSAPRAAGRLGALLPEHMSDADCRRALAAVRSLREEKERTSEEAVIRRMRDMGAQDAVKAVHRLKRDGSLAEGIGEAVVVLADLARHRAVKEPLLEVLAMVEDGDLDAAKARLQEVADGLQAGEAEETGASYYSARDAAIETLEEVKRRAQRPAMEVGPLTPLARHFSPGDLVVVGGETNAGKSQLALLLGLRWHHATGQKLGIVSTEDRAYVYGDRLVAMETNHSLLSGEPTRDAFEEAGRAIERLGERDAVGMEILDDHDLTAVERAMARLVRRGCGVLAVDYLQTISDRSSRRDAAGHERVENIVRRIKAAGKRLRVPVMLVSQLSRPQNRTHREPTLFELKGSGYIEQAATAIVLVWKPEDNGESRAKIAKLKSGAERPRVVLKRNEGGMVVRVELDKEQPKTTGSGWVQ